MTEPYAKRKIFALLVERLRELGEQGTTIAPDAPELDALRTQAHQWGVSDADWRFQVQRARAYVRRFHPRGMRLTAARRWRIMQQLVELLRDDPALTADEAAYLFAVKPATARRYIEAAWQVVLGDASLDEVVWGGAGRRGRPPKRLELQVSRDPLLARAVSEALQAARAAAPEDRARAMRAAVGRVLEGEGEDRVLSALRIAQRLAEVEKEV